MSLNEILKTECREIGKVYETTNYGIFKNMPFNRDVSKSRYNKIMDSFRERPLPIPINVNENLEVLDGQGRLKTLMDLGLPVPFVIIKNTNIEDCIRINRNSTKWGNPDYIVSFAKQGNENYVELIKCKNVTGLPYERILELAHKDVGGTRRMKMVSTGRLKFTPKDTENVRKTKSMADEISSALPIKGKKLNREFLTSVLRMVSHKDYKHEWMLSRCQLINDFRMGRTRYDVLKSLSDIYNYNKRGNKIHFEDIE